MDKDKERLAVDSKAECKTRLIMSGKEDIEDSMKHEDNSFLIKFVFIGSAVLLGGIMVGGLIILILSGLEMISLFGN